MKRDTRQTSAEDLTSCSESLGAALVGEGAAPVADAVKLLEDMEKGRRSAASVRPAYASGWLLGETGRAGRSAESEGIQRASWVWSFLYKAKSNFRNPISHAGCNEAKDKLHFD